MVIYGHAYALKPIPGEHDTFSRFFPYDYSGSIAMKIFFFISGLVVTNSMLEKDNVWNFAISRFFRIMPALAFVLCLTAFVLGPLATTESAGSYFSHRDAYLYVVQGIKMNVLHELPGVFRDHAYTSANGCLWSIPVEVFAYFMLVALYLLGVFRRRWTALLAFFVILTDSIFGNKILFTWMAGDALRAMLAPCFALGALMAVYKNSIRIDGYTAAGAALLYYLMRGSLCEQYYFCLAFFVSLLYVSCLKWTLRLKPSRDISYGVYLWGWPVGQLLVSWFPDKSTLFHQLATLLAAALCGLASWELLEKRCIRLGSKAAKKLVLRFEPNQAAPSK